MSDNIIVIGGGVSGITAALTLQLLGYDTKIVTEKKPTDISDKNAHPQFASLYPSASIIPHSVYSNQLESIFKKSQEFFYELRKLAFPGLVMHKHFEIFEDDPVDLPYRQWMLNLHSIEELEPESIPQRSNSPELYGWAFDCIFADWPLYFPALIQSYREHGGTVIQQKMQQSDLKELSADIIINCSGMGSPELFEDPSENQLIMRGHLLHKVNAPLITNNNGEVISYNYTPKADMYSDSIGNACDVYCYPRKDGWILGGSRQVGSIEEDNKWQGLEESSAYSINNIQFPRQIIDLNNEILHHSYNQSIGISDEITPFVGYRYIRNRKNGLRLQREEFSGKTVYHNYGHGGAGVTLSWGCVFEITQQITGQDTDEVKTKLLNQIDDKNR